MHILLESFRGHILPAFATLLHHPLGMMPVGWSIPSVEHSSTSSCGLGSRRRCSPPCCTRWGRRWSTDRASAGRSSSRHEPALVGPDRRGRGLARGRGHAAGPPAGPGRQLLQRRRPRRRCVRRAGHRLRPPARSDRVPGLLELRRVPERRRDRGAPRGAAVRDGAVPTRRRRRRPSAASSSATPATSCTRSGPAWRPGTQGASINPWAVALFDTLEQVDPTTAPEQAAFSKWLDQTSDRESARNDRIHGAAGVIPDPAVARAVRHALPSSSSSCCSSPTAASGPSSRAS